MSCQSTGIRTDAIEEARLACSSERKAEDVHTGSGHHPTVVDDLAAAIQPGLGGGVIPTNGNAFCVFAAMPPVRFRAEAHGDASASMADVLRAIDPDLWLALEQGTTGGPIRSWPGVRAQFRKPYGPGWALVGDAGHFKDPFAAHGISDAFRDAELLTDAIVDGDFARYEEVRDHVSMPMFDVMEQIASYNWDMKTLPDLHLQLSQVMREEEIAFRSSRQALPAA